MLYLYFLIIVLHDGIDTSQYYSTSWIVELHIQQMFHVSLKIHFFYVPFFNQGGLASVKTSATSCWSSSPFCGNMATFPTISNAARTPRQPRRSLLLNRHQRSLPCSTRRRAWWSHKALGNTLSHRLNSASTCLIRKRRGRCGHVAVLVCLSKAKQQRALWLDFVCCPEGFEGPRNAQHDWLGWLVSANMATDNSWILFESKDSRRQILRTDQGTERKNCCNFSTNVFNPIVCRREQTPATKRRSMSVRRWILIWSDSESEMESVLLCDGDHWSEPEFGIVVPLLLLFDHMTIQASQRVCMSFFQNCLVYNIILTCPDEHWKSQHLCV